MLIIAIVLSLKMIIVLWELRLIFNKHYHVTSNNRDAWDGSELLLFISDEPSIACFTVLLLTPIPGFQNKFVLDYTF
jgi:hypothetical protein